MIFKGLKLLKWIDLVAVEYIQIKIPIHQVIKDALTDLYT